MSNEMKRLINLKNKSNILYNIIDKVDRSSNEISFLIVFSYM